MVKWLMLESAAMHRPTLSLSLRRLRGTLGVRFGAVVGLVVGFVFSSAAASGHVRWANVIGALVWLGAGPVALSAAHAPRLRDQKDGVEVMVALRGVGAAALRRARVFAAAIVGGVVILVPTLIVAATVLVVAATGAVAVRCAVAALVAAAGGALVGTVGSVCGEIGERRGRSLLLAVVIVPWALSGYWRIPSLSLVGLVEAGLSAVRGVVPWV
jgi:hypothetical protein